MADFTGNYKSKTVKVNSLKNKIVDLKQVLTKVDLEILVIAETKLDESFPNPQ